MARAKKNDAEYEQLLAEIKADFDARLAALAESPAEWLTFIETAATFGARYSLGNQFLLMMQAYKRGIEPTYFLPFGVKDKVTGKPKSGWLKEGRCVRKGEASFKVWAPIKRRLSEAEAKELEDAGRKVKRDASGRPAIQLVGFRLSNTFELSQTDGDDFEIPSVQRLRKVKVHGGKSAELLTGDDPTGAYGDVVKLIEGHGYSFELVAPRTGFLGSANGVTVREGKKVQVRNDVSEAQRIKTTVHELAHIRCGHLDGFDYSQHRGQAETEAESVAHLVLKALGIDSQGYSDAYVLNWANGDMDVVKQAAENVLRVAKSILVDLTPADENADADERELVDA